MLHGGGPAVLPCGQQREAAGPWMSSDQSGSAGSDLVGNAIDVWQCSHAVCVPPSATLLCSLTALCRVSCCCRWRSTAHGWAWYSRRPWTTRHIFFRPRLPNPQGAVTAAASAAGRSNPLSLTSCGYPPLTPLVPPPPRLLWLHSFMPFAG
mgnify:CR=1 FL=1